MGEPSRTMERSEYLARSESWDVRCEWLNGVLYAMAGGRAIHAAVQANVIGALMQRLAGGPCRATTGDQRVHVLETGAILYPDVTVICGPYEMSEEDSHSVVNPTVVVEVLSPSTADYDHGAKFGHYRRITSLRDVLLIDPDTSHVVHYARVNEGWLRRDIVDGDVVLTGPEVSLPLTEIYANLGNMPTS